MLIRLDGRGSSDEPSDLDLARSVDALTLREREIVALIARGPSNKEIAEHLGLQLQSVKNRVHEVLNKLGARNRTQAVHIARQLRIV